MGRHSGRARPRNIRRDQAACQRQHGGDHRALQVGHFIPEREQSDDTFAHGIDGPRDDQVLGEGSRRVQAHAAR